MGFDDVRTACVIRYAYVWAREAASGETEGRKSRPVAVGVRLPRPDGDGLILFPITTLQPDPNRFAIEIPDIEKSRAGLDVELRLWIILDEYNEDVVGRSFYLEPGAVLGRFSRAFFLPVMRAFIERKMKTRGIKRS